MRKTKLKQHQIDFILDNEDKNHKLLQDLVNYRAFCQFKYYTNQMAEVIEDPEGVGVFEPESTPLKEMLAGLRAEATSEQANDILKMIRSRND